MLGYTLNTKNVDHANDHSSFLTDQAPIRQSNLCLTGDTRVDVIIDGIPGYGLRLDHVVEEFDHCMTEDIRVLSYNEETGKQEYKKVTAAARTGSATSTAPPKLMKITDDDTGKSIECTPEHEIYTQNRGYVMAKDLKSDDILKFVGPMRS